jgi:hypothetical protein
MMEIKIGITGTQVLNSRSLIFAIIVAGIVTGGNLWIHRNEPIVGYLRYTGHGISFDYPALMNKEEADLGGLGPATDSAGIVQISYHGVTRIEQYGVMWVDSKRIPSHLAGTPEGALDFLFEFASLAGTQIADRGEYKTTTKTIHEVIYQSFSIPEGDYNIPAIIGVWHCENTNRFLTFYLIYVDDFENINVPFRGLEQMWLDRLNGITCH